MPVPGRKYTLTFTGMAIAESQLIGHSAWSPREAIRDRITLYVPASLPYTAEEEYEPREGDLVRDRNGDLWFFRGLTGGGKEGDELMASAQNTGMNMNLSCLRGQYGPVTLVFRDEIITEVNQDE